MDYAAALEDNSNAHADRIIEIEVSVDGQTVLTNPTKYAASAVATGTNNKLSEIKATTKHLAAPVTTQAATVATLSTNINGGSSGAKTKYIYGEARLERVRILQARSIPQEQKLSGV